MKKCLLTLFLLICLPITTAVADGKKSEGGFWSSVKQTGSTVWGGVKDSGKRMNETWDGKEPDKPLPSKGEPREGMEQWQEK
ncbi:MAG: hypothetical protein GY792_35850 [Gammaproteobacteria bacterium]|nr:hypothetical protein [Gammaproteobacteria bacterium]